MGKIMGIYKIINRVNGMFYIGSSNNLHKREREHFWALKGNKHVNPYLQNAFNKYGLGKFKFIVVEIIFIEEDIRKAEQRYINNLNACDRSVGYNINECASGGGLRGTNNPNFGKLMSEQQKEKIRKTMIGIKYSEERCKNMSDNRKGKGTGSSNYNYGRIVTEEEKILQSEKMKGRFDGKDNPFYGKNHKEHSINKMKKSHAGKTGDKCLNSIKIIQLTKENIYVREFNAMQDAQRETGIWASNIQKCCIGKLNSAGGYRWQYLSEYNKQQALIN